MIIYLKLKKTVLKMTKLHIACGYTRRETVIWKDLGNQVGLITVLPQLQ